MSPVNVFRCGFQKDLQVPVPQFFLTERNKQTTVDVMLENQQRDKMVWTTIKDHYELFIIIVMQTFQS